jgi:predicted MFS family arabinose efflux permease
VTEEPGVQARKAGARNAEALGAEALEHATSKVEARASTRIIFFVAGWAGAVWAALVPFTKSRIGIGNGGLGLLLLCLGAGSIIIMPLAGALVPRAGCRAVIAVSAAVLAATLPLLASLSSVPLLVASLLLFGAALGSIDVAMNVQAIIVERASRRAMMSGFHGMFSLGGIAGAGGMAASLSLGIGPLASTLAASLGIVGAVLVAVGKLLPYGSQREGPPFALPRGVVLLIGALCCAGFLAEGAVLDWGGVFLTSERSLAASNAGLGYATFALTMTIGRLTGDRVVARFGGGMVVILSGFLSAVGFAITALVPFWPAALLGFALVGAGCSNIAPVLFTAIGRQRAMPENVAVPAVTTLGYAGILAGPAGVGFIAQIANLPTAFLVVAAMLAGVGISGRYLRPFEAGSA